MKLELFLLVLCVGCCCFRFGSAQEDDARSWPDNNNYSPIEDHHIQITHNVAEALVEVVSDATGVRNLVVHSNHNIDDEPDYVHVPTHNVEEKKVEMDMDPDHTPSNQRCEKKKKGIWKRWARKKFNHRCKKKKKGILKRWARKKCQRGGTCAATNSSTGRRDPKLPVDAAADAPVKEQPKKQKRIQRAFEAFRFRNKADMEETMAGSRLLSGSFRLLSSTAGFVASSVRVSGDTAAGIMGSSIKIVGSGVKSIGAGCSAASRLLDTKNEKDNGDSSTPSKSSRYNADEVTHHNDSEQPSSFLSQRKEKHQKKHRSSASTKKFVKRSQKVAAKSVRLLGNVMDGLGETLLIVGVAAESLTSATVGVAEETVRIVEELAGTVSIAISLRGEQRRRRKDYYKSNHSSGNGKTNDPIIKRQFTPPPFISFGTYPEGSLSEEERRAVLLEKLQSRWMKEPSMNHSLELLGLLASDITSFGRNVSADVEGVPSMAMELAAALLFCHLVAVLVFYRRPVRERDGGGIKNASGSETAQYMKTFQYSYWFKSKSVPLHSMVSKDYCHGATITPAIIQFVWSALQWCFLLIVKLPYIMLRYSFKVLLGGIFSRHMFLFLVYGLVWAFLSRHSQNKALLVQRHAEAVGFRNGLATISETSIPTETTMWLNNALGEMWRVDAEDTSFSYQYPVFVRRALKATPTKTYGGLEPYLSSAIGSGIVRGLEIARALRPTDVAYVSLFSLSLGSQPPILKSVKLVSDKTWEQNRIEVYFEVDAFLEDLAMVLEVKLSSLRYALLPSTQIKVHSVNFRASFKAVLFVTPQYPFVSSVELSMLEQPVCDLRVTPVSEDSFLHGVDLGSIPFLDDWVKEAIRAGLSKYVSPRYVSIGIEELLHSTEKSNPAAPGPNLDSLRRNTRFSISNPRTSIPEGLAMTSIADKLESHHTSSQPVVPDTGSLHEDREQKSILKPMTELSRLALNRHAMKQTNRIRPATELARLGLDRWLDSRIMMKYSEEGTSIDIDNSTV